MARYRTASMWGPNPQLGVRRPDRSVSLNPGDVQRMGIDLPELFHGSRTKIGEFRHMPPEGGGPRIPGIYTTPEEAIGEQYGKPPPSDKPSLPGYRHSVEWALDTPPRVLDVLEPVPDELRAALRGVDIPEGATVLDLLAPDSDNNPTATRDAVVEQLPKLYDLLRNSGERGAGLTGTDVDVGTDEWLWLHPDKIRVGGVAEIPARVDPPYVVAQGLSSADRALLGEGQGIRPSSLPNTGGFTPSPALSGPGGFTRSQPSPVLNMAMTGEGQESLPGMSPGEMQRRRGLRGVADARGALGVPMTPEQEAARRAQISPPRQQPVPPPVPPVDRNPQSQMSQTMLANRFAQQRAQPQQGYAGGTGAAIGGMARGANEWVQGMSNADRIALLSLLLAGGAAATGVGSPLTPLIMGGGAALSGQL